MIADVCTRWRGGRHAWRPAGELFRPSQYEVARTLDVRAVRAFTREHHYSRSCCSTVRCFELRARGGALSGVAVFSSPQRDEVLRPWRRGDALELGRLVLLDGVEGNAESWFVGRCFEELRREGLAGAVSFADPEPRATADAGLLFPGHVGVIYQALNAVYTGRASPKTQRLLADGREFPNRAMSKIRKGERGVRYSVAALVDAGARAPAEGEDLRAWLRAERSRLTAPRRHQGNHRYAWAFTEGARRDLRRDTPRSLPYPKFNARACAAAPSPAMTADSARRCAS